MEHGLKDIAFYFQKTYNTLHSCHNYPAVNRQAARHPHLWNESIVDHSEVSWSFRSSWSIACRRCSNWIFILDLTPGFYGLAETIARRDEKHLSFGIWCLLYKRLYVMFHITYNWKLLITLLVYAVFRSNGQYGILTGLDSKSHV